MAPPGSRGWTWASYGVSETPRRLGAMRWPESRRCRRSQNAGHRPFRAGTRVRAKDQWNPDSRRQDPCDDLGGRRDITRGHNEQRRPEGYIGAAQSVRAHPFRPASAHSYVANERQEVRQHSNRDEPPQPRPVQQAHNGCGQGGGKHGPHVCSQQPFTAAAPPCSCEKRQRPEDERGGAAEDVECQECRSQNPPRANDPS